MEKKKYWIIKLGNLFYAGGSPSSINRKEIMNFRFVRHEEAAAKFTYGDVAEAVAKQIGGITREKEVTQEMYDFLDFMEESYHKKPISHKRNIDFLI